MPHAHRLLAIACILLTAHLTACTTTNEPSSSDQGQAHSQQLGHVHGLGVDPGDGSLYIASHFGVFRYDNERGPTRVADRWQDTMAFTVIGSGHFLASGHPDMREDLPAHLGLIESTDAAKTWAPLSLQGKADLHALESAGEWLYGYDAASGRLLVTRDHIRWEALAEARVVDLVADPEDPNAVIGATPDGRLYRYSVDGAKAQPLENAPRIAFLDGYHPNVVVAVAAAGTVYLSRDGTDSWQRLGDVPGHPQALSVTADEWHVATTHGLFRSTDDGRTWTPLGRT